MDQKHLLTTGTVSRMADVSAEAVRRWTATGQLRCVRTGGGVRLYRRADVERFLAKRRKRLVIAEPVEN